MSNTATIKYDTKKEKWVAWYGEIRITSSNSLEYIKTVIEEGTCKKAEKFGVTDYIVETEGTEHLQEQIADISVNLPTNFDINQRFEFMSNLVNMVINDISASVIVTGEGGLGKTYTVMDELYNAGMKDTVDFDLPDVEEGEELVWSNPGDYTVVKGFSTAKGLYRTLYENRNKLIVFDDCDSILRDRVGLNLLKAALDSYDKRYISWMAESSFGEDDLPRVFEFTGRIIFISNLPQNKIDQAIKSRSLRIDLSMTPEQKIDRMEAILENIIPDYSMEHKTDALEFLRENCKVCTDLNMRTLISVTKIRTAVKNWKDLAMYTITA